MLTVLHSNGVRLVVCEKYDRVARDSMWIEWAIRYLRDNGFSLISASEPELANDADTHRKAMRGMVAIFAELEKSALVLKLRAARQRARASRRDYREGRKPYGTRPGEKDVIERIRKMRAANLAYDTIPDCIDVGHELVFSANRQDEFDLQVAVWLADSDAVILTETLEQLNALLQHSIPTVTLRVLQILLFKS